MADHWKSNNIMMRLQKFLALAGVASRRKAEELITNGQVKVDGQKVTELGTSIDEDRAKVEFGGKVWKIKSDLVYFMLNKPVDYITSSTSAQGKSVLDLIKVKERVYPIGRLDKDSRGLLILTNDGELTNKLTQAKFNHEKEYEVILDRELGNQSKRIFEKGMILDEEKLRPVKVVSINGVKVRLILKQGVNRQIRRMAEALGYRVKDLKRIRIGKLNIGNLPEGKWKVIKKEDII